MRLKKKWLVIFPLALALLIFLIVYFMFNKTDENNFTVQETNWINENKNSLIDIATVSDYPVFGESGVFKEFLNDFSEATGFNFNNTSVLKESKDVQNWIKIYIETLKETGRTPNNIGHKYIDEYNKIIKE